MLPACLPAHLSSCLQVILETNQQQGGSFLKFMPSEDISIGVWLMSLDLRRVDHPQVCNCAVAYSVEPTA
jgi:hypothetical protein